LLILLLKIIRRFRRFYSVLSTRSFLKNKTIKVFGQQDILFEDRINIGDHCSLNHQVYINGKGFISIGDNVTISAGAKIISTTLDVEDIKKHKDEKIIIENNVWIGAGAIILCGIVIRENSIIAAGALVNRNVGPNEIWGGVPAKLIKAKEAI
jgi:acetyltransferase-like isoleucine patch superfamily enzyme